MSSPGCSASVREGGPFWKPTGHSRPFRQRENIGPYNWYSWKTQEMPYVLSFLFCYLHERILCFLCWLCSVDIEKRVSNECVATWAVQGARRVLGKKGRWKISPPPPTGALRAPGTWFLTLAGQKFWIIEVFVLVFWIIARAKCVFFVLARLFRH